MSLNRVGLGPCGGERGSNESRAISLKKNKCECLQSPWCILPLLKTCSDAGWLICLLRSCAEWQGALFVPSTRSQPMLQFTLQKSQWHGKAPEHQSCIFIYTVPKRLNYALCIPKSLVNQTQSWHNVGIFSKERKQKKTSKTTKTPVSKQGTFLHSTAAHSLTTFHRFSSFITNPKAASFSPVEDVTSISFMPMQFRGPQKIFPLPVITAKCISTLSLTDFFCLIKTPGVSDEGI